MTVKIDLSRDALFDELGLIRLRESYMRPDEKSPQERLAFVAEQSPRTTPTRSASTTPRATMALLFDADSFLRALEKRPPPSRATSPTWPTAPTVSSRR